MGYTECFGLFRQKGPPRLFFKGETKTAWPAVLDAKGMQREIFAVKD